MKQIVAVIVALAGGPALAQSEAPMTHVSCIVDAARMIEANTVAMQTLVAGMKKAETTPEGAAALPDLAKQAKAVMAGYEGLAKSFTALCEQLR